MLFVRCALNFVNYNFILNHFYVDLFSFKFLFVITFLSATVLYDPLRASSYLAMPKSLKDKKACLNIQNDDENCFLYCILAALHPVTENGERVNNYIPFMNELSLTNITMPMKVKDITKFEKQNNISVNVFGCEQEEQLDGDVKSTIISMRVTEKKDARHHVNVLYFKEGSKSHYVLVKDKSRLLSSQVNNHRCAMHFCDYCLHGCSSQEIYERHIEKCKQFGCQRTTLPEKDDPNGELKH